jgi:hypothetical protein
MRRKAELEDFFGASKKKCDGLEPLRRPKQKPEITTEEVAQEASASKR